MSTLKTSLLPSLIATVDLVRSEKISPERIAVLKPLIDYIQGKLDLREEINLHFICTHNSRRSQLSQIWAQTAASYFGVDAQCYSGGVEVTAFNKRALDAIKRSGFQILAGDGENPVYQVFYSPDRVPVIAFSKLFDDKINNTGKFAAVMTCSQADESCPYIPNAEKRFTILYEDPKAFDNTPDEEAGYDHRSHQIASEMFYVFSSIKMSQ